MRQSTAMNSDLHHVLHLTLKSESGQWPAAIYGVLLTMAICREQAEVNSGKYWVSTVTYCVEIDCTYV